jgi:hypothetical protein
VNARSRLGKWKEDSSAITYSTRSQPVTISSPTFVQVNLIGSVWNVCWTPPRPRKRFPFVLSPELKSLDKRARVLETAEDAVAIRDRPRSQPVTISSPTFRFIYCVGIRWNIVRFSAGVAIVLSLFLRLKTNRVHNGSSLLKRKKCEASGS